MKTKLCVGILMLAATWVSAQTNSLSALLQQGLFEEQANGNLDAAIANYQTLEAHFDKERQILATAVFRLGECYRAQGHTNEAAGEYRRILSEFSDQQTLASLSRQDLVGLGIGEVVVKSAEKAPAKIAESGDQAVNTDSVEDREIEHWKQLLQTSPDLINAPIPDSAMGTPLIQAATFGWLKVANYLMDHGADVNCSAGVSGAGEARPLVAAVLSGNKTMTKLLIDRGAKVNFQTKTGDTPLHLAARKGFTAVAEVLLASHADVDALNDEGTPLVAAVQSGQLTMVQTILAAHPNVNAKDSKGRTALNYVPKEHPEIYKALLDAGIDPNTVDADGRTVLSYHAADESGAQIVKLLLAAKANPNAGTAYRPLLCAVNSKNLETSELLLRGGANPNLKGWVDWSESQLHVTPLFLAVATKQLPMVQLLLKFKGDPNDSQTDNQSLLFTALNQPEIVQTLLEAGASAEATNAPLEGNITFGIGISGIPRWMSNLSGSFSQDDSQLALGVSLLQAACRYNQVRSVELLLQHGANANCMQGGSTPLDYAIYGLADEKIFAALLDHKADPNARRSRDHKTLLGLLKENLPEHQTHRIFYGSAPAPYGGHAEITDNGRFESSAAKKSHVEKLITLLRERGALENPPDMDQIAFSRAAAGFSTAVFVKNTNNWNHFSLLEAIYSMNISSVPTQLLFADLSRITIVRPQASGSGSEQINVNLLEGTNGVDCSRDVPLEFGDVVEIPEREHPLAENTTYVRQPEETKILNHFREVAGTAKLVVEGGASVELPLQPFYSEIGYVLTEKEAQAVLTSKSDLAQVKVSRRNPTSQKLEEWTVDCSQGGNRFASALWIRAGDVITVPLKP